MKARLILVVAAVPLMLSALLWAQPAPSPVKPQSQAEAEAEIKRIAQELLDAIAPGDKAVWERYLDDAFVMTDEEGNVSTRKAFLDALRPLPQGFSGSIQLSDPVVRLSGDVAILTHLDLEEETIFGQELHARFRSTDTYVRRDGRWKLLASQVMVIPDERKTAAVDPALYDDYVGLYQLSPTVRYQVTREGNRLFGQRTGRQKEELLPESETSFFLPGTWRGVKIFARDASGRVTHIIDRRDNRDLVWKRVP
jgi:ketosteroid isomerase-like protein